jgi:hypothetical protein
VPPLESFLDVRGDVSDEVDLVDLSLTVVDTDG